MRTILAVSLISTLPAAASAAGLPDPGWDAQRCGALSVSAASVSGSPGERRVEGFRAALAEPDAPHLRADTLRTSGPASLDGLPILFAGGLLVALEHHRPDGCDFEHAFRRSAETAAALPQGAQADQRWTGLRVETGGDDYRVASLHLHAVNGAGGITHISEEATGLSSAGNDMTATPIAQASIRVSMPHERLVALAAGQKLKPSDAVRVDALVLNSADTHLDAHGTVEPASRSGHLIVHAQNMEGIKAALPVGDRDRAGAMFLVMRLGAKQEQDGSLSWDVMWDGNDVTINGISLPVHF
jgi:hypothetical protein